MPRRYLCWVATLTFLAGAHSAATQTRTPPQPENALATVKSLKCSFSVSTSAVWQNGEPEATVKKGGVLALEMTEIDTADSTALVTGLDSSSHHIVAQLSGWNLHFLDIRPTGSLTITTVFGQVSRDKKLKAVHTRTAYLPVSIPGFAARPDVFQYYGECELGE